MEEIIEKLIKWQKSGENKSVFLIAIDDKEQMLYHCLQGDKNLCKKGLAVKIDTDEDFLDIAMFIQTFLMLRENKQRVN